MSARLRTSRLPQCAHCHIETELGRFILEHPESFSSFKNVTLRIKIFVCCSAECLQKFAEPFNTHGCNAVFENSDYGVCVCGVTPIKDETALVSCTECRTYICPECDPMETRLHVSCWSPCMTRTLTRTEECKILDATLHPFTGMPKHPRPPPPPGSMTKAAKRQHPPSDNVEERVTKK
jgi:hypothetical protein